MLKLCKPEAEDLSYRSALLMDEATMAYNEKWGGTIDFSRQKWDAWYEKWLLSDEKERYYRYLYSQELQTFVGEVAYRFDETYGVHIASIIVEANYRGKGFGRAGLRLLMEAAKENGITKLCDDIAADNPSVALFLQEGFREVWRNEDCVMVEKIL